MEANEYLTVKELAARLKLSPKTVENKMATGIFKKGIHYFAPPGLRPRFKWSAVVAWIEGQEKEGRIPGKERIPMARGYFLAGGLHMKDGVVIDREKK